MITAHHLVFGRKYAGYFLYPFTNTKLVGLSISTRNGNIKIDKGDGSAVYAVSPIKNTDFTTQSPSYYNINYTNPYTGNLKVITDLGNADVYSIGFSWVRDSPEYQNKYNIPVLEDFFAQFPNLYSIYFDVYAYGKYGYSLFAGNFAKLPNSVERVKIQILQSSGDRIINFNDYSINSKLKYFEALNDAPRLTGDLKLPPLCTFFKGTFPSSSTITYTSGKVWASSFDTLDIGNASLSPTETDNLFNDMANSITTAIGSKVIRLANCYRTTASNSAVSYLQSLGFTITVLGVYAPANSKILDLPLQNNFTDTTGINTMIAGGTSNLPTFTLEGGEYAATFNGSQSLKTNANFVIGTDKVSISFWIKTSQTALTAILELSSNINNFNAFGVFINNLLANRIDIIDHISGYNLGNSAININDNNWHHVILMIDRSLVGNQQNKIYVDGILSYVQNTSYQSDLNGNWGLFPLFIGQRGGSLYGFNGRIKFLKMFNYPLSTTEITNLYNKTM